MKTLMSNEYRTASLSIPSVMGEANEARGYDLDPADLLIAFEEDADALWKAEQSGESRGVFVDRFVSLAIANL